MLLLPALKGLTLLRTLLLSIQLRLRLFREEFAILLMLLCSCLSHLLLHDLDQAAIFHLRHHHRTHWQQALSGLTPRRHLLIVVVAVDV